MGSQIILLNGPSSSGKSTLLKTLQALIWEKMSLHYEVVSIDDFMKTDPMETIYEDDVFEISGDLCDHVLERMKESSGVIIDHVITSERIYQQLKNAMEDYTLFEVHVECSLEILKKREQERKDRCPGSAEASATYLFPKDGYDLTVDSGLRSAEENARIIFEALFKDCV